MCDDTLDGVSRKRVYYVTQRLLIDNGQITYMIHESCRDRIERPKHTHTQDIEQAISAICDNLVQAERYYW